METVTWRNCGERWADGFQPRVKRRYTLNHFPQVIGELWFSHAVNGDALYLFQPLVADQSHLEQLVELKHVTERE
jgi:hypothetical protein